MLLQKPKAVSLESPVVPSPFHINKVDFPAHYRLRGELARTMGEAEALITLGPPSQPPSPQSCWCSVMALYDLAGGTV